MDTTERKAVIRDMINSMIKGETEVAEKHFHDVLSAKTRDRLNPSADPADLSIEDPEDEEVTGDA